MPDKQDILNDFMDGCRQAARYWAKQTCTTEQDRCDGVAFSIMTLIDGCAGGPAFDLATTTEDGKDYYISEMFHELYYKGEVVTEGKSVKLGSNILARRYLSIIAMREPDFDTFAHNKRLSLFNLEWMCKEIIIHGEDMSEDKISRWLGFIQGCLAMRGMIDVDEERDTSRALFPKQETREIPDDRELPTSKPVRGGLGDIDAAGLRIKPRIVLPRQEEI